MVLDEGDGPARPSARVLPLRRPGDISEVEAALMASMNAAIAELQALSSPDPLPGTVTPAPQQARPAAPVFDGSRLAASPDPVDIRFEREDRPLLREAPLLDAAPLLAQTLPTAVSPPSMDRAAPGTAKASPSAPPAPVLEGPVLEGKAGGSPTITRAEAAEAETGGSGRTAGTPLHQKSGAPNFRSALATAIAETRRSLLVVFGFTIAINVFVLAIPIYLFQISDRVLTSRSTDTLAMLTVITVGAIVGQVLLDILRRRILMRTAASIEVRLGAPILSAAARSALGGSGRDYQILGDLAHLRSFITGGTLLSMLDAPLAPIFLLAVWFVHPHLGVIVAVSIALLLVVAILNKRATAAPFAEANAYTTMANLNLEALSRNSQIINALGMIPEAVRMWGRENAKSLSAQALAQDRNVLFSGLSKAVRLGTQVTLLGWGAMLALEGHLTGGMVIASSIIASRALAPVEGTIEGWRTYIQSKSAFGRISNLLRTSPLNLERLRLPTPLGRLDVDRILFVPAQTKKVILNGLSFRLAPGESMAIIGSSGAGKSTLGKMLVGSIIPTAGNIRLDLMDLKNWDARQFGESIGYLPQDIQLFPASIKANIARMREDVTDEMIFEAAALADVHALIASFPQGYETIIGSDGAPLSGGQKQRIGLARAFFGNPKLVVLDEPNSNLDTAGEQALAQALLAAKKKGTTVVAITQRTALLRCVDKIMIMKDGTVQAIGERQKILKALAEQKKAGTAPKDLLLAD
ncbi:ABC transporter ATP-binding protein [Aureimonas sp. Leaf460]|nr:ABC transporter ATP-binding protein [Aureimonas sp. Leaf427]KQT81685.1 ABC transporter ATP-binding protein [Aureimonas sp. Leaf460]